MRELYTCTEIGQYDATTYYGWFTSDAEAVKAFQAKVDSMDFDDSEEGYVVERVERFTEVENTLKAKAVTTIRWRRMLIGDVWRTTQPRGEHE